MTVLVVVVAYLLGTVPTALVVGRRLGRDPTREGSGNPGASNVYRTAGARAGAVVFAGDLLKGVLATGMGLAAGSRTLALACGAAAVVGHVLPVTRRFRGGKGVATASGLVVVLDPLLAAGVGVIWLLVAKLSGRASVASLVAAVVLPMGLAMRGRPMIEVAGLVAVAALVIARHAGNIERLVRGDEHRLEA